MRRLAAAAGATLVVLGCVGTAEAQPRYRPGVYGRAVYPYYHHRGGGWGGALAAGVIGGAVLGGLAAAAAPPAYAYPPYPYGYGYPGYGPAYGGAYYPAPVYRRRYVYSPYYGPPPGYAIDPYAAPHEIRGGYRTIYVPGRGRVIPGWPGY
jgi:hypothetical protein